LAIIYYLNIDPKEREKLLKDFDKTKKIIEETPQQEKDCYKKMRMKWVE